MRNETPLCDGTIEGVEISLQTFAKGQFVGLALGVGEGEILNCFHELAQRWGYDGTKDFANSIMTAARSSVMLWCCDERAVWQYGGELLEWRDIVTELFKELNFVHQQEREHNLAQSMAKKYELLVANVAGERNELAITDLLKEASESGLWSRTFVSASRRWRGKIHKSLSNLRAYHVSA